MAVAPPKKPRRRKISYFSTVLSIGLVLFMLGLFGLIVIYANEVKDYVRENVQFTVLFREAANEAEVMRLQKQLEAEAFVKRTEYISKEQAMAILTEELGEQPDEIIGFNPLPATIEVYFESDFAVADSIEAVVVELEQNPLVREVHYQRALLDNIDRYIRTAALAILGLSLLLLIIAITIINSTIRLTLFSKRFLIKSMQLVGATPGFIRRPFMLRALLNGFLGTLLAIALLALLVYGLWDRLPLDLLFLHEEYLFILAGSIILLGLLITWLSSYFALNRYLRLKLDELY